MLFISIHKIEGCYISTEVKFWVKDIKNATYHYSFYLSSEKLVSTDQFVQACFTVFGFCQTLIFIETFHGKYFFFLNSVIFGFISEIKSCQFNEFDAL